MAILERVATLVRANLNDLIDRAEDPEKMIKQVILLFVDGKLRLTHPFRVLVFVFLLLFPKQMFIRNRDRDLSFDLKHLILHIENHLLQHLLRVLRAID